MRTNLILSIVFLVFLTTASVAGFEIPPALEKLQDTAIQIIGDLIPIEDNVYQLPSITQ